MLIKEILYQKVVSWPRKLLPFSSSTLHIPCNNIWYIHNIVAKQGRDCTTSGWDCLLTWLRSVTSPSTTMQSSLKRANATCKQTGTAIIYVSIGIVGSVWNDTSLGGRIDILVPEELLLGDHPWGIFCKDGLTSRLRSIISIIFW